METKICIICRKELFATTKYFYKKKHGKLGLDSRCIKCCSEINKQYYKNKRNLILERQREYRISEQGKEYLKNYYGCENYKASRQKYKCSEKGIAKDREIKRGHHNRNKLSCNMSCGVWRSLKENKSFRRWKTLVPYNIEDLKLHLENLFQSGMTWDNYGEWHIDHKIPITSFKFISPEDKEFQECWSLSNLQPLWAKDNIKKSNKMIY